MKTFVEIIQPAATVKEEITGFPTFSDVRSSKYKASVKEEEITKSAKKLEELKAELAGLQQNIEENN